MNTFNFPAFSAGIVVCFSTLILSACGGSSASDPGGNIAITADNALDILINGKSTFDYALDAADNTTDLFDTAFPKASASNNKSRFAVFSSAITSHAKLNAAGTLQAPLNVTVSCESGSLSYNGDFTQTSALESVNTTLTFDDCVYMGVKIDGSITVQTTHNLLSATGSGKDSNGNLSVSFEGKMHIITNYSGNWSYDETTGHQTTSESFSFNSPSINGSIAYRDTATWNKYDYASGAYDGSALITGTNNSKLRISAIDDTRFLLEVDADGDGSYEFSQAHDWSVLNENSGFSEDVSAGAPAIAMPVDATIITTDNADLIAATVLDNIDIINAPLALFTDITCDSGFISIDSTDSPSTGSFFITLDMDTCDVISNVFYTGAIFYHGTYNPDTIYITSTSYAFLSLNTVADDYQLDFTLHTNQTSSTEILFDYDFSLSNTNFGGVLVNTSVPLVYDFDSILQSGELIVYGAAQSRLRISIIDAVTSIIEIDTGDGIFVAHSGGGT